jgi:hypothetical protein
MASRLIRISSSRGLERVLGVLRRGPPQPQAVLDDRQGGHPHPQRAFGQATVLLVVHCPHARESLVYNRPRLPWHRVVFEPQATPDIRQRGKSLFLRLFVCIFAAVRLARRPAHEAGATKSCRSARAFGGQRSHRGIVRELFAMLVVVAARRRPLRLGSARSRP